ncbi:MAG TPA: coenzyme F420-0:L-glutamate ligase [Nitrososphaera sp.]|nr:coenzyme F420-0:L-glutamate ligase [Nitrososphaera sp.]
MGLEILPIRIGKKSRRFDLFKALTRFQYLEGDIIVVSSKFMSMSEGAVVRLAGVRPSAEARALAAKWEMDAKMAELVIQESDYVVKGVAGFLLAIRDGMIAPNAGIDKSNAPKGHVILYPRDAFSSADELRKKFRRELDMRVGIVVADSRLMPTRKGATGVAIACSGFEPVEDLRGKKDLFGHVLRVTMRAVADSIATMGVAVMGESSESTPAAVVRGARVKWSERKFSWKDMAVSAREDIYFRGIESDR